MAWAKKRRKTSLLMGFLLIAFSLTTLYACARQAKSEPVTLTTSSKVKPVKAKSSPPAKSVVGPLQVVVQAEPPMQVEEKELVVGGGDAAKDESLFAPPPVTGLPKFADPRELPTPGPPYNQHNTNPDVVMRNIPKEATGVEDWVKAFKEEIIHPHESLDLDKKNSPPLKFDVEIPAMGSMPNVIFPHFPHTFWLDCTNCHPGIFMMKKGGNPISMVKIVNGEFCGRCHGRIAFPIANCTRCHVKPKEG